MDNQQGQEIDRLAQQNPTVRAQEAMLRMARHMQEQGHVHEAQDMYMQLLVDYPGTQAAIAASNAMMDLAEYLEQNGMPRQALDIYRKLEQFQ